MAYPLFSGNCMVLTILLLVLSGLPCKAQLSDKTFYDTSCPAALNTIRGAIRTAVSREPRMAASLIRLHFHDCFVQGCDASIMLDDTPTMMGEKNGINNINSARGFNIIENIKADLETRCSRTVSCADILAVAARDASVAIGGPTWPVKLGRRDATNASVDLANDNLPRFTDSLQKLRDLFIRTKGLTERDLVALSGAHTIGQSRCFSFRARVNSNESIDPEFARSLREDLPCPADGSGNENLAPLDQVTPNGFDNNYFKNLVERKGLLQSDQVLFSGESTDAIVNEYIKDGSIFRKDFAAAMVKMGDFSPKTGNQGRIGQFCNVV
ncbi:lignin-forming anionic peroxidase [Jatropha curcas]|uniref:lignin-forming anionic peroxidase n=1 Tax=Jatropha curcas TaxID=180498 RepID=UPI0005FB7566|nr:lignin-forming anionic peroxidase [Jatropha curcas]